MKATYKISGMTCDACKSTVQSLLAGVPGVRDVSVNLEKGNAVVESNAPVPIDLLQEALKDSVYRISRGASAEKRTLNGGITKALWEENRTLVLNYLSAVWDRQYELLLEYLSPEFVHKTQIVLDSARAYAQMLRDHEGILKSLNARYELKVIFVEGDAVCVIYEMGTDLPVAPVPFYEWIKIKDGRIVSAEVTFDRYHMQQLVEEQKKRAAPVH